MNYAHLFNFILEEQKRERQFYEEEEKLAPFNPGMSCLFALKRICYHFYRFYVFETNSRERGALQLDAIINQSIIPSSNIYVLLSLTN